MKTRYLAGLILILALGLALPLGAQGAVVGTLTEVAGRADLMKGGNPPATPVKVGDGVETGDVIRTKPESKAQVKFVDDTILNIAPESRVAIEEYMYDATKGQRRAVLQVFRGMVHTVVARIHKVDEPDFVLKTHTTTMGIRGSEWYAHLSARFTDIYTVKGLIRAQNIFREIRGHVDIGAMMFSRVFLDLPPTVPMEFTLDDLKGIIRQFDRGGQRGAGGGTTGGSALEGRPPAGVGEARLPVSQSLETYVPGGGGQSSIFSTTTANTYIPPVLTQVTPTITTPASVIFSPFYIQTMWGAGGYDLDLHLTGPQNGSRFHVYFANTGSLTSQPFAQLQGDYLGTSGSEVITVGQFNPSGVYRASVYNYGNSSPTSTNLSTTSGVSLQLIQGGTVVTQGSGHTVSGGTVVTSMTPPTGQAGNTWRAVEINPATGQINRVNQIVNSTNSASVQ